MTTPVMVIDRDPNTRVTMKWTSHVVQRARGVELAVERRDGNTWRRVGYVTLRPGDCFDLLRALSSVCDVLENGGQP